MKYAKAIVAILAAGTVAAQNTLPLSEVQHAWVAVAIAVLGAVGVLLVPNKASDQR